MFTVISCITTNHSLAHVLTAAIICVLGSCLAMRLFSRARKTDGVQKLNWLFLAGFVGGTTIWTTHFVAMLGYETPVINGYDPLLTLASLVIGIVVTTAGFSIIAFGGKGALVEAGGVIIGMGVVAMHYVGIAAYDAAGHLEWSRGYIAASVYFAVVFGAVAANLAVRAPSRRGKRCASLALVLAIVFAHFTSMAGLTIVLDASVAVPHGIIPSEMMTVIVSASMIIILMLGASTYTIDMQSTRAAVKRYRHLSLHDPLTGLPNRAALNEHLEQVINAPANEGTVTAIFCFDLDRFKEINDVHGHAAGDAVLRAVAERLSSMMRPGEFIARVGGDEFVVIVDDCPERSMARDAARRILDEICKPVLWRDQVLTVGSSIGISGYPRLASNIDDLLSQADIAMYRAKGTATNTFCFYEPSMDQAVRDRHAMAMEMRDGVRNGEFELFYQQQNDTVTREVVGFEALLRWRHPQRGMIGPVEFIPIAEKTGFIVELGEWVLRHACIEAASWERPLTIAVNVAPQQLADAQLPQIVQTVLDETGLDPARLELEITETGIIADQQHALHIIRELKRIGVKVAMDDYGTGYSSLSTLQSFPFDKIKIDRAFVDGVVTNVQSAAIVRSTLILAQSLQIPVLAEGVEREEHIEFLRNEGCLQVQGYLFGKPTPSEGIRSIVSEDAGTEEPPKPENWAA